MSSTAVIGLQWGDEGKGKIIDSLTANADMVVRYAGGNNAGHTVYVGDEKYVLHLIPGGILHDDKVNLIGRGLVVNLAALHEEIDGLVARGVPVLERLRIDGRAHLIFPYHCKLDGLAETWRGSGRIGTTGRGIGPAYSDKVARTGIRLIDVLDTEYFKERLKAALAEKDAVMRDVYKVEPDSHDDLFETTVKHAEALRDIIVDGGKLIRDAYADGKNILFEGAQGAMLDLDAGTYPYVTSSWTGIAGIAGGTGFPANKVDTALAVTKAYCTRVGEGPFPSELHGKTGEDLRAAGREFGATTGRPRRCGWFDAVQARYACEFNGLDGLFVTKLDILSGFDEIKVCTAYRLADGSEISEYPADGAALNGVEPIYHSLPGWAEDLTSASTLSDLPDNCVNYLRFMQQQMNTPIVSVSVGPGRNQSFDCEISEVVNA